MDFINIPETLNDALYGAARVAPENKTLRVDVPGSRLRLTSNPFVNSNSVYGIRNRNDNSNNLIVGSLMTLFCDVVGGVEHTVCDIERTSDYYELDFVGVGFDAPGLFDLFSRLGDARNEIAYMMLATPLWNEERYLIRSVKNGNALEAVVELEDAAGKYTAAGKAVVVTIVSCETVVDENDHTMFRYCASHDTGKIAKLATMPFFSFNNKLSVRLLSAGVHVADVNVQNILNGRHFAPSGISNALEYNNVDSREIGEFGKVFSYVELPGQDSDEYSLYLRVAKSYPSRVVNGAKDRAVSFLATLGENVDGQEIVEMTLPINREDGVRAVDDVVVFHNGFSTSPVAPQFDEFKQNRFLSHNVNGSASIANYPYRMSWCLVGGGDEHEIAELPNNATFPCESIFSVTEASTPIGLSKESEIPFFPMVATAKGSRSIIGEDTGSARHKICIPFSAELALSVFDVVFCKGHNISQLTATNAIMFLSEVSNALSDDDNENLFDGIQKASEEAGDLLAEYGFKLFKLAASYKVLSSRTSSVYSQRVQKNKKVLLSKSVTKETKNSKLPYFVTNSRFGVYAASLARRFAEPSTKKKLADAMMAFVLSGDDNGNVVDTESPKTRDFIKSVVLSEATVDDFPYRGKMDDMLDSFPIVIHAIDENLVDADVLAVFVKMLSNALPIHTRVYDNATYRAATKTLLSHSVFQIDEDEATHMSWYDFEGVLLSSENSSKVVDLNRIVNPYGLVNNDSIRKNTQLFGGNVSPKVESGIVIAFPSSFYSKALSSAVDILVAMENVGVDITTPAVVAIFCNGVSSDIEKVFGEQWRVIPATAIANVFLGERYNTEYSYNETEIPKNHFEMPLIRNVDWESIHYEFKPLFGGCNLDTGKEVTRDSNTPRFKTSFLMASMLSLVIGSYATEFVYPMDVRKTFKGGDSIGKSYDVTIEDLEPLVFQGRFNNSLIDMEQYGHDKFKKILASEVFYGCDYKNIISDEEFKNVKKFITSKSQDISRTYNEMNNKNVANGITTNNAIVLFSNLVTSMFNCLTSLCSPKAAESMKKIVNISATITSNSKSNKYDWAISYFSGDKLNDYGLSRAAEAIEDDMTVEQYRDVLSFILKFDRLDTLIKRIYTEYSRVSYDFVKKHVLKYGRELCDIMDDEVNQKAFVISEDSVNQFKQMLGIETA